MKRAHAQGAVLLLAAGLVSGCDYTTAAIKAPADEFKEGNYVMGTVVACLMPIALPIYMLADVFIWINPSEETMAAVGQATQDYVTARAAQDQAAQQQAALAQQQAQLQAQQQAQQQREQQQQYQLQQQPFQLAQAQPQQPLQDQQQAQQQADYMARQQAYADQQNAAVRQQAEQLRQQNEEFAARNALASNCLSLLSRAENTYGGFRNSCNFPVYYSFCNAGATGQGLGNFSDAFDCAKGQFGLDGVAANGVQGSHTNAPRTYWAACKQPYTPSDVQYNGSGVTYRCRK